MKNSTRPKLEQWYTGVCFIDGQRNECRHKHSTEAEAFACAENLREQVVLMTAAPIETSIAVSKYARRLSTPGKDAK